ncbi:hypothetical protein DES39_0228 [Orbus hercynius]|uniref:UPF0246 protein DES39_0228 n=1 Tax=Orbus hercynius TaxID=593135 RepID=A0A495RI38_9GAMM|nr:peroxide stress protein YaaA [Orbus hercynius]RKS87019.1 hypothetical protein DES39_0228 [Orbus hercynius]
MLTVLSPAKKLDYQTSVKTSDYTQPELLSHSAELIPSCQSLSAQEIGSLMKISPKLAETNYQRFQDWQLPFTPQNARQAIFAFNGEVYEGLHVKDFSHDDLTFAQHHLRILSGLYGVLKPLDLMQPYRLEMGTKLKNGHNSNLYQFWGDTITEVLNQTLAQHSHQDLINLASHEYFKSVNLKKLQGNLISPVFLDEHKGDYKIIGFYAKRARGLMSRYIIKHQLDKAHDIQSFNLAGYQFDAMRSTDVEWVFTRSEQQAEHHKNH